VVLCPNPFLPSRSGHPIRHISIHQEEPGGFFFFFLFCLWSLEYPPFQTPFFGVQPLSSSLRFFHLKAILEKFFFFFPLFHSLAGFCVCEFWVSSSVHNVFLLSPPPLTPPTGFAREGYTPFPNPWKMFVEPDHFDVSFSCCSFFFPIFPPWGPPHLPFCSPFRGSFFPVSPFSTFSGFYLFFDAFSSSFGIFEDLPTQWIQERVHVRCPHSLIISADPFILVLVDSCPACFFSLPDFFFFFLFLDTDRILLTTLAGVL